MGKIRNLIKMAMPYGLVKERRKEQVILDMCEDEYPQLFNKEGKPIVPFYLQDEHCAHHPWTLSSGRVPTQVYWDRFNWKLHHHMYVGLQALHTKGAPLKKFALIKEAEVIAPETYQIFRKNPGLCKEFDRVFTFSEELLNAIENAAFVPASTVWVGTKRNGGVLDPFAYEKKTKMISMIASHKTQTENQVLRVATAKKLKMLGLADTFGRFDGGSGFEYVADALTDYRFQVVIENETCAYTFTEKLFNCLATMTVPVYYGATKVGEFFNTDGMIILQKGDLDSIERVVSACSEQIYYEKLDAIKDNFERVKKFLSIEDYLFENYSDILL